MLHFDTSVVLNKNRKYQISNLPKSKDREKVTIRKISIQFSKTKK